MIITIDTNKLMSTARVGKRCYNSTVSVVGAGLAIANKESVKTVGLVLLSHLIPEGKASVIEQSKSLAGR